MSRELFVHILMKKKQLYLEALLNKYKAVF